MKNESERQGNETTISNNVADFLKSEDFNIVEEGIGWRIL